MPKSSLFFLCHLAGSWQFLSKFYCLVGNYFRSSIKKNPQAYEILLGNTLKTQCPLMPLILMWSGTLMIMTLCWVCYLSRGLCQLHHCIQSGQGQTICLLFRPLGPCHMLFVPALRGSLTQLGWHFLQVSVFHSCSSSYQSIKYRLEAQQQSFKWLFWFISKAFHIFTGHSESKMTSFFLKLALLFDIQAT